MYHCGSSRCRFLLTVFFTGSFSPQVFVRHLTGDTWWRERTTGAWTWSVMLWKVRGVIWHIILWCTWKLSQTTCQSIFSVDVFLYCIIFLNNEDFYFASSLFFCSLTFFWSRIQTMSKRSTSLFLLSRVVEKNGWKLCCFSSPLAFIAVKFYTDQTEVVLLNGVESFS